MELTDIKSLNKIPTDPRLRSEKFRQDVRLVLDYLGLENNMGNFKKYDIDWETFADGIRNPKQTAVVEILFIGTSTGKTRCVDLPGATKTEAIKKLDTSRYIFRKWW